MSKEVDLGETRIIECKEITLSTKDVIIVKNLKDFKYLIIGGSVFRKQNHYYLLSNDVAFVWFNKDESSNTNK